jgi:hypothetical protein
MTDRLMQTVQAKFHGRAEHGNAKLVPRTGKQLDVAGRMRDMW